MSIFNRICRKIKYRYFQKDIYVSLRAETRNNIDLEGKNFVGQKTLLDNVKIGLGTYVGDNNILTNCKIGRFCSLARYIQIIDGQHPTSVFVSTHPAFFSVNHQCGFSFVNQIKFEEHCNERFNGKYCVEIGNDVWIGTSVGILEGVRIGDGAIVAAGSLVNKDVPPYAIVGGVPAKIIRYRFEEDDIAWLQDLKWWNKGENWIRKNAEYFEDLKSLRQNTEKQD